MYSIGHYPEQLQYCRRAILLQFHCVFRLFSDILKIENVCMLVGCRAFIYTINNRVQQL